MNFKKATIFLMVLLIVFSNVFSCFAKDNEDKKQEAIADYLKGLTEFISENTKYDTPLSDMYFNVIKKLVGSDKEKLKEVLNIFASSIDEYSYFLTGDKYKSFKERVVGDRGVVGILLEEKRGIFIVTKVMEGLPAQRAGIIAGDVITAVNGETTQGKIIDEVVNKIRGKEYLPVELTIKREGIEKPLNFTIIRTNQQINPVTYKFIDDKIAHIIIETFNGYTDKYFAEALSEVDKKGIKKIVLDLRYNSGGSLNEALKISSHFVTNKKKIVTIKYKDSKKNEEFYSTLDKKLYDVVVLVNEYSASASEIVSGAILDNKAGTVIGTKTFGKATVQQLLDLPEIDSCIGFTIAEYLTPSGVSISKKGVTPNIIIENSMEKIDEKGFEKLSYEIKPKLSDKSKAVLAVEQRLSALGYDVGTVDEEFTKDTYEAVCDFQYDNKLFVYGVCDVTTQMFLSERVSDTKRLNDKQFKAALAEFNK